MRRAILTVILIACFYLPCAVDAQTVFAIDPRGTYLRTNQDTPQPPLIINLTNLSLRPGQYVRLEVQGACRPGPQFPDDYYTTIGVFSSNNTLLATNQPHRVPGAIVSCGAPIVSNNTHFGNLPTDIPQDFVIAHQGTGRRVSTVRIPEGAAFLFVCFHDSFYQDNTDPNGDYRLRISQADSEGDVNGDCCVDDSDLLAVLFAFGQTGAGLPEDLNNDGTVDDADLLLVLFNFGNGC
jgi:hypothetical protein